MRSAIMMFIWALLALPVAASPSGDTFVTFHPDPFVLMSGAGPSSLPVWVAAGEGELRDVRLDFLYGVDPDGRTFMDGVSVNNADGELLVILPRLGGSGHLMWIVVDSGVFSKSGKYRLTLRFAGKRVSGEQEVYQFLEFTAVLKKPDLSIGNLPQGAVRLYRNWPLGAAKHDQTLTLLPRGSLGEDLSVLAQVTSGKGDETVAVAGVRAEIVPTEHKQKEAGQTTLQLTGLSTIGNHKVDLVLSSSVRATPVKAAFRVIVTDHPWWALLAVLIGVFVSFFLRYLVEVVNPAIDQELTLSALRENLARLLEKNPREDSLLSLREKLGRIALDIESGKREPADQAMETVRGELDGIRDSLKQRRQTVRRDLAIIGQQISQFRVDIGKFSSDGTVAEDETFFSAVPVHHEAVSQALDELRTAAAEQAYTGLVQAFGERVRAHALDNLSQMSVQIRDISNDEAEGLEDQIQDLKIKLRENKEGLFSLWREHSVLGLACEKLRLKHANRLRMRTGAFEAGQGYAAILEAGPEDEPEALKEERPDPGVNLAANRARRKSLLSERRRNQILISLVALILASALGFANLYDGAKAFGTFTDYATALAWGFGFDNGVRGVGSVLTRLRGGGS